MWCLIKLEKYAFSSKPIFNFSGCNKGPGTVNPSCNYWRRCNSFRSRNSWVHAQIASWLGDASRPWIGRKYSLWAGRFYHTKGWAIRKYVFTLFQLVYTKESDIFAFGVLWSELMNAVDRNVSVTMKPARDVLTLETPLSSNDLESKLFSCGLGNKPELSEAVQDTARNIVNK